MNNKIKELFDSLDIGSEVIYDEQAYHYQMDGNKTFKRGTITNIEDCEWMEHNKDSGLCHGCVGQINIDHRGAKCMVYGGAGDGDKCFIREVIQIIEEDFLKETEMLLDL